MVVMEINLLTGFEATNVDALKSDSSIRRVESSDKKVVLYLDKVRPYFSRLSVLERVIVIIETVGNNCYGGWEKVS